MTFVVLSVKVIDEKLRGSLGDIMVEMFILGPLVTQHVGLQISYVFSENPNQAAVRIERVIVWLKWFNLWMEGNWRREALALIIWKNSSKLIP